jgi:serine/alanine adding enzyme
MHELIPLEQPERWERAYARAGACDVFYRHGYARLCAYAGEGEPLLFAYEDGAGGQVLYVFLRRTLQANPLAARAGLRGDWADLITPTAGYGGPLCNLPHAQLLHGFRREFDAYCRSTGVVSEFIRFHPVLRNYRYLDADLAVLYDRETVCIDLTLPEEELWLRLHPSHQRNVRKARQRGLELRVLEGREALAQVEAFFCLYAETMLRLGARRPAFYSADCLQRHFEFLGSGALLGAVFLEDRMLAGALCLREGALLHYHLGGSREETLHLGSNVALFHGLALWGQRNGLAAFHLGGGHRGRDSLFQFKHRFNPGGTLGLHVGRKVHHPDAYTRLVGAWMYQHGQLSTGSWFPAYRAPAAPPDEAQGTFSQLMLG